MGFFKKKVPVPLAGPPVQGQQPQAQPAIKEATVNMDLPLYEEAMRDPDDEENSPTPLPSPPQGIQPRMINQPIEDDEYVEEEEDSQEEVDSEDSLDNDMAEIDELKRQLEEKKKEIYSKKELKAAEEKRKLEEVQVRPRGRPRTNQLETPAEEQLEAAPPDEIVEFARETDARLLRIEAFLFRGLGAR